MKDHINCKYNENVLACCVCSGCNGHDMINDEASDIGPEIYEPMVKGIIHIGANTGIEYKDTTRLTLLFEPVKSVFKQMFEIHGDNPNVICFNKALGSVQAPVKINLASNNSESASILKPLDHLGMFPGIHFEGTEWVGMDTLDNLFSTNNWLDAGHYDEMVIDVQGYEMKVLQGAEETLKSIDKIQIEVNEGQVYSGCAQYNDVVKFLTDRGFSLEKVEWHKPQWGDAYFVRN